MTIKHLFIILLVIISHIKALGQGNTPQGKTDTSLTRNYNLNDGPYIIINNKKLIEKKVVDGELLTSELEPDTYPMKYRPDRATFKQVDTIAVLSDVHGQYDLTIEILINNKIITPDLSWNFGNGHLVFVGDVFDRGEKVTELLWFIHSLEKQAKSSGGKVHYLLGNHEYMVLQGDIRYINEKYSQVSELMKMPYSELYGTNTVLGRWLRSKPTILKIDDKVFVHGGISEHFLALPFKIKVTNRTMRKYIDMDSALIEPALFDLYFGEFGPIWYRGYFFDDLTEKDIDSILGTTDSSKVIVGHCSNEEVVALYNNKIYGVDSSIKKGEYGELLFIENNRYSRGLKNGERKFFD